MSRIGKTPIQLDDSVKIEVDGARVSVTGPKGTLTYDTPDCVSIRVDAGKLIVDCDVASRQDKAAHGLARSLLQGMVTGVTAGFRRELECQGVGYRGKCQGRQLTLNLGYSHPVEFDVPEGVDLSMPDQTHIVLESIDKQLVGQTAATIRAFRPPDSYKGKGIRHAGEQVTLKEGKTVG